MKKPVYIDIIAGLLVILFTYAAINKLLEFHVFKLQLRKSPVTRSYFELVSWIIPVSELLTVGLLMFRQTRIMGFIGSFILMTMFTIYIGYMLASGIYLPCSCGGILNGMSWRTHFFFNLVFLMLSGLGAILQLKNLHKNNVIKDADQPLSMPINPIENNR